MIEENNPNDPLDDEPLEDELCGGIREIPNPCKIIREIPNWTVDEYGVYHMTDKSIPDDSPDEESDDPVFPRRIP
jgi:hypothetical protein